MSALLAHLLLIASGMLLLPATILLAQVVPAVTARRRSEPCGEEHSEEPRSEPPAPGPRARVAVLVPAHDEAVSIVATLRSIAPQLASHDRLIVVADNCMDRTAALAAREGSEVVVRTDCVHRGKGHALHAGIRYLQADAPEIVIVIDADSRLTPGFIDRLARRCAALDRPVQARYLMLAPANAPLKTRIAAFAWVVKNHLRPFGLHRLGLPCQLMGSGMAFPWACISTANLSTGHIVEDLKLGIELALRDYPAAFCPQATVTSVFPASSEGLRTQRARWEHGHLGVILSDAPTLLWQGVRRGNFGLFALALDLCVPPVALLVLAMMAVCFADALLAISAHALLPLGLSVLALTLLGSAVLLCWAHEGRRVASFGALALSVVYALWKLPLYLRFLTARQTEWVRSRRDGEPARAPTLRDSIQAPAPQVLQRMR